jgi:hypothetical protein
MDERIDGFMEYTKRRNLNRGYMKLEVWQQGMELFARHWRLARVTSTPIHQSINPLIH